VNCPKLFDPTSSVLACSKTPPLCTLDQCAWLVNVLTFRFFKSHSPIAILFINTATGSGPAIGLALDGCAPDIMDRPPVRHGIFTREAIMDCLVYGFAMGGLTLVAFSAALWGNADGNLGVDCNKPEGTGCDDVLRARGDAFLTLNTLLLLHAYNCRHQRLSLFAFPLFENKMLWGSIVAMTIVTVPILYAPFLR
jgi:magnesium-transporting ATPase (P-type)